MAKIEVLENPLQMGQVKKIYSNGGEKIDSIELLFSPTVKATFYKQDNKLKLIISDTQFRLPEVSCLIDKKTVRDLVLAFKDMHNELESEEFNEI